jgi:predicted nucleic acid-binding protein
MKDNADDRPSPGDSPSFVDTNVLVYAIAGDDATRSPLAQELLRELMHTRRLRTSTQVLQELYVTLTRKGKSPLAPRDALRYIDQLAAWPITITDFKAIRRAIELSAGGMFSFWDALIVVAAVNSGAKILYSEDLQAGHEVLGLRIVNPFEKSGPAREGKVRQSN